MKQEEFAVIDGFENYAVSTYGRIMRVTPGPQTNPGDFKAIQVNKKTGYTHVKVSGSLGRRSMAVHRLVAETFLPNENNYREIDHIDRDKTNNHVDNLRWCTRRENLTNMAPLRSLKPVLAYPPDGGQPLYFLCIRDAAKYIAELTGLVYFPQGISNVLTNPQYTHYKGWKFKLNNFKSPDLIINYEDPSMHLQRLGQSSLHPL